MPRNEREILTLFESLSFLENDNGMLIIVSKLIIGFNGYTLKNGQPSALKLPHTQGPGRGECLK